MSKLSFESATKQLLNLQPNAWGCNPARCCVICNRARCRLNLLMLHQDIKLLKNQSVFLFQSHLGKSLESNDQTFGHRSICCRVCRESFWFLATFSEKPQFRAHTNVFFKVRQTNSKTRPDLARGPGLIPRTQDQLAPMKYRRVRLNGVRHIPSNGDIILSSNPNKNKLTRWPTKLGAGRPASPLLNQRLSPAFPGVLTPPPPPQRQLRTKSSPNFTSLRQNTAEVERAPRRVHVFHVGWKIVSARGRRWRGVYVRHPWRVFQPQIAAFDEHEIVLPLSPEFRGSSSPVLETSSSIYNCTFWSVSSTEQVCWFLVSAVESAEVWRLSVDLISFHNVLLISYLLSPIVSRLCFENIAAFGIEFSSCYSSVPVLHLFLSVLNSKFFAVKNVTFIPSTITCFDLWVHVV